MGQPQENLPGFVVFFLEVGFYIIQQGVSPVWSTITISPQALLTAIMWLSSNMISIITAKLRFTPEIMKPSCAFAHPGGCFCIAAQEIREELCGAMRGCRFGRNRDMPFVPPLGFMPELPAIPSHGLWHNHCLKEVVFKA